MTDEPLHDAQDGLYDEPDERDDAASGFSLTDDIMAMLEDGKTYLEAEKAYQKSRARFAVHHAKRGTVIGLAGFALIHAALVGLMVGLVMALAPHVTVWGAIAIVAGGFIVLGLLLARLALERFRKIGDSFEDELR
jgi:hypothetical protein